ncbi:hypothetical protein F5Y17DRAFT_428099 [Xylariaceae sp. FL0594]|nr:hypothetical protein F5Y17DRAFT_428099 [Xylariaceae sp. FL0594]
MAEEGVSNMFAFRDLGLSAKWLDLSSNTDNQFFATDIVTATNSTTDVVTKTQQRNAVVGGFFKIPPVLIPPDSENHESEDKNKLDQGPELEPLHDIKLDDFDVLDSFWQNAENSAGADAEYRTWEAFSNPDSPQPTPVFITEGGPSLYDAAIMEEDDPLRLRSTDDLVVQSQPFVAALLALILGRGSVFFGWDDAQVSFVPTTDKIRLSGYSTAVLRGLQRSCIKCGSATRMLSKWVQVTYTIRSNSSPVRVALARAVDVILLVLQQQLGKRGSQVRSLLQLQSLVAPVETLLGYLDELVDQVCETSTDEEVLSLVYKGTQEMEAQNSPLQPLMCEILARVTEPWADFAQKWIGVKAEEGFPMTKDGPGKSFVDVVNITSMDDSGYVTQERDYALDESRMPVFVPRDIGLVIFETGRNLRLLRTHHPNHPLCDPSLVASYKPPALKWLFDWKSIEMLQGEVRRFEEAIMRNIISRSSRGAQEDGSAAAVLSQPRGSLQVFGSDGAHLEERLLASIQELDQAPAMAVAEDGLAVLLEGYLFRQDGQVRSDESGFSPHWSLLPLLSFEPLATAQAKAINREYMRLLFTDHNLREHLRVQKQVQLLGNGMFCSRLSHALFDPDLDTAERKAGVALSGGIMGLRMNGRESWPPASSELRLALIGVLSEIYTDPSLSGEAVSGAEKADLPGDLSFSLRNLPPEEIDKCMDPSSLEALDFLRLAYNTPAPLSPIITPLILMKYDRIFKLLLRILRMLYVVGQLYRDTRMTERRGQRADDIWIRFSFEAQHYVQSIAAYFFDTGIQTSWNSFEQWLDKVEFDLSRQGDAEDADIRVVSPGEVQQQHDKMLNNIMNVLLLRKRRQPVMALVEDIFRLILKFSRQVQLEVGGKVDGDASHVIIQELYGQFRKKLQVFVTVCRGLSEREGGRSRDTMSSAMAQQGAAASDEESTVDRLLVNLDMLDYYSRPRF